MKTAKQIQNQKPERPERRRGPHRATRTIVPENASEPSVLQLEALRREQLRSATEAAHVTLMETNCILRVLNVCIDRTSRAAVIAAKANNDKEHARLKERNTKLKLANRQIRLANDFATAGHKSDYERTREENLVLEAKRKELDEVSAALHALEKGFDFEKFLASLIAQGVISKREMDSLLEGKDVDGTPLYKVGYAGESR